MPRLVFTRAAQLNLIEIGNFIERRSGSAETAEHFCNRLIAKCQRLARLRGPMGRPRPELLPDLRSTPHGNYLIFLRYADDTLEIVNILEGHLEIDAYFRRKKKTKK